MRLNPHYTFLGSLFWTLEVCWSFRYAHLQSWKELNLTLIVKFIYSEKATNFCKISSVDLSLVVAVKSTVEISQNFVAFSENMNFKRVTQFMWKGFDIKLLI